MIELVALLSLFAAALAEEESVPPRRRKPKDGNEDVELHYRQTSDGTVWVSARTMDGREVGEVRAEPWYGHQFQVQWSRVDEEYQRQGLASHMYDLIEARTGKPLTHGDIRSSPGALRLWRRRLGKSEDWMVEQYTDWLSDHEPNKSDEELNQMAREELDLGASGILVTDGSRILLLLRSEEVSEPETWGIPGGSTAPGETPLQGAMREALEEIGGLPGPGILAGQRHVGPFTTFVWLVDPVLLDAFRPRLNWEHDHYAIVSIHDALSMELHPGLRKLLERGRLLP